jgi:hypothetical protein
MPTALQVLGGDGDVAKEQAGLELHVKEDATKPIATACPACGGGLSVGRDAERTIDCRFCHASVFIPDELWKRFHPGKTMLRWTITYTGALTSETLERYQDLGRPEGRLEERGQGHRSREP